MSKKEKRHRYAVGVYIGKKELDEAAEQRFVGAYHDGVSLEDLRGRFRLSPSELGKLIRKLKLPKRLTRRSSLF